MSISQHFLEMLLGIEPRDFCLQSRCSTSELQPFLWCLHYSFNKTNQWSGQKPGRIPMKTLSLGHLGSASAARTEQMPLWNREAAMVKRKHVIASSAPASKDSLLLFGREEWRWKKSKARLTTFRLVLETLVCFLSTATFSIRLQKGTDCHSCTQWIDFTCHVEHLFSHPVLSSY